MEDLEVQLYQLSNLLESHLTVLNNSHIIISKRLVASNNSWRKDRCITHINQLSLIQRNSKEARSSGPTTSTKAKALSLIQFSMCPQARLVWFPKALSAPLVSSTRARSQPKAISKGNFAWRQISNTSLSQSDRIRVMVELRPDQTLQWSPLLSTNPPWITTQDRAR